MKSRIVSSCAGVYAHTIEQERHDNEWLQKLRTRPPDEILRASHAASLSGLMQQIAMVSFYALEVFEDLRDHQTEMQERLGSLQTRMTAIAEHKTVKAVPESMKPREISFQTTNITSTRRLYAACERVPPLEMLDEFVPIETTGSCRLKYSNPSFFVDDWMQQEEAQWQKHMQLREARRQQRKPPQEPAEEETDKKPHRPSKKLNFLNIRSWKEVYGTGEGKELRETPSKPQDGVVTAPIVVESVNNDPVSSVSMDPHAMETISPPKSTVVGAFMEEIEDLSEILEIETQFHDCQIQNPEEIPPPPPSPPSPPSPPPCEPEEEEQQQEGMTEVGLNDDIPPPPPPPEDEDGSEFPPPPPPPISQMSLLREIQLGARLRHVNEDQTKSGGSKTPMSSRADLLDQLKRKQNLRPVERPAPSPGRRQSAPPQLHLSAPFASSIARILERRSVLAYDSDDSDTTKAPDQADESDHEW